MKTSDETEAADQFLGIYHVDREYEERATRSHSAQCEGLRDKGASYDDIAEILKQEGVQTSDTTVRKFCHKALIGKQEIPPPTQASSTNRQGHRKRRAI